MDKEYIDSPRYWVRQHTIGKAYNVDKYTLNRFIEALEWQVTEYEQLQSKFNEAVEVIKFYSNGGNLNRDIWFDEKLGYFTGKRARDFLYGIKNDNHQVIKNKVYGNL